MKIDDFIKKWSNNDDMSYSVKDRRDSRYYNELKTFFKEFNDLINSIYMSDVLVDVNNSEINTFIYSGDPLPDKISDKYTIFKDNIRRGNVQISQLITALDDNDDTSSKSIIYEFPKEPTGRIASVKAHTVTPVVNSILHIKWISIVSTGSFKINEIKYYKITFNLLELKQQMIQFFSRLKVNIVGIEKIAGTPATDLLRYDVEIPSDPAEQEAVLLSIKEGLDPHIGDTIKSVSFDKGDGGIKSVTIPFTSIEFDKDFNVLSQINN
jgi:hypothetical protein